VNIKKRKIKQFMIVDFISVLNLLETNMNGGKQASVNCHLCNLLANVALGAPGPPTNSSAHSQKTY
jgi:hypothetical protein